MPQDPCQADRYADLHVHSSASDGVLPPAEVVRLAAQLGFSAISICDHDTIAGLPEALSAAEGAGIELVPGIEISTYVGDSEVHILGYYFDSGDASFLSAIHEQCRERFARIEEIIRRLANLGVSLDLSPIDKAASFGSVGRLHIARAMVEQGFVSDTKEAFAKYIGRGKPAYVPRAHLSPGEACCVIRQARGIPVLAHPSLLDSQKLIPKLVREGILGIEAFYSRVSLEVARHYCRRAEKLGLLVTGGSDCHQGEPGEFLLGTVKLEYGYVEKLKQTAAALRVSSAG